MGQPGLQVEPAVLERVAGDVETLRDDHDRAAGAVEAAAEEVGRKLAGWELAKTTENNAFAWRDDATQATGWLDDYATALRRCARDYRHSDQVSADALALFPEVEQW